MSRNQLLENAPKLPSELKWELKRLFSENLELKFEDFDQVVFKRKKGDFWMVELIRDGVIFFGFVDIIKR
jgi:hypothetical protein